MKRRYIEEIIKTLALKNNKMAFISGPRQSGKTTLAKILMTEESTHKYFNWDDPVFRRQWIKDPKVLISDVRLAVFDEIHKAKNWKRNLKGIYDTLEEKCKIIVTGSARLNVYKKGGDSLLGRYLNFRLHPFTVGELLRTTPMSPDGSLKHMFADQKYNLGHDSEQILKRLLKFGGFPEPYLKQSKEYLNLWQIGRSEKIVKEDLRDLSRIPELNQVEALMSMLPERAANPLSIQSLREDLEIAHDTAQRYIKYLKELYYIFEIKPYSKVIPRSIKKEGKLYLWDWSEVPTEGEKFENLVASHLLKACDYWTDSGHGAFKLFYLKNKQKKEIDFLIVRDNKPWVAVECKSGKEEPSPNFKIFLQYIKCDYAIQILNKPNVWEKIRIENTQLIIGSASRVLSYLP